VGCRRSGPTARTRPLPLFVREISPSHEP
jgi:hypothetical protein